mmetsp:Transcript_26382/g.60268  ORF Transcript_26382/g.60268 Transcript_26382/m.60268 type:complete len:188 (+) Transcript_26382:34-597(+)
MALAALPQFGVLLGVAIIAWCAYHAYNTAIAPPPGGALSLATLKPCFFATGGWVGLLYSFLFLQSAASFHARAQLKKEATQRGEKPPSFKDVKYSQRGVVAEAVHAMDRTVGNFLEQSLPLLLGLYLHAVLVSPSGAAAASWLWLLFRSYYPLVFNSPVPGVFASTMPAYACLLYLWGGALGAATRL